MRHHWPAAVSLALLLTIAGFAFYYARQGTTAAQPTAVGTAEGARRPLPFINHLAFDPTNPQHVFMAARAGVFISHDGGRTWNEYNRGLLDTDVTYLALDPFRQGVLLAATGARGVFRSVDGGSSWHPSHAGMGERRVNQVVFDPAAPGAVYALTPDGVFRSADGGQTWQPDRLGLEPLAAGPDPARCLHLAVVPGRPSVMFLGTTAGTFRREGGSGRWTQVGGELSDKGLTALTSLPGSGLLLAGTAKAGVFVSEDGGRTWRSRGSGLRTDLVAYLLPDPADPRVVYAAAAPASGISKSTDGGATWKAVDTSMAEWPWGRILAGVPGTGGTLYAVTGAGANRLYRSDDGGLTWLKPVAAFPVTAPGPQDPAPAE